jgi:NAD(P)H-dependent FMN reductase
MNTPRIGIVISTTREGRFGDKPAQWIYDIAAGRDDLDFEIVDLRDYPLGFYGEARFEGDRTAEDGSRRWREKMASLDGFIIVTAEYNHGYSGVLKNALDHAYAEYNRKPASFIGYGGVGGARAVQQLRLVCVELQMAPLRSAVHIAAEPMRAVRQGDSRLADFEFLNERAATMLDELAWWTYALKAGRGEIRHNPLVDELAESPAD